MTNTRRVLDNKCAWPKYVTASVHPRAERISKGKGSEKRVNNMAGPHSTPCSPNLRDRISNPESNFIYFSATLKRTVNIHGGFLYLRNLCVQNVYIFYEVCMKMSIIWFIMVSFLRAACYHVPSSWYMFSHEPGLKYLNYPRYLHRMSSCLAFYIISINICIALFIKTEF